MSIKFQHPNRQTGKEHEQIHTYEIWNTHKHLKILLLVNANNINSEMIFSLAQQSYKGWCWRGMR